MCKTSSSSPWFPWPTPPILICSLPAELCNTQSRTGMYSVATLQLSGCYIGPKSWSRNVYTGFMFGCDPLSLILIALNICDCYYRRLIRLSFTSTYLGTGFLFFFWEGVENALGKSGWIHPTLRNLFFWKGMISLTPHPHFLPSSQGQRRLHLTTVLSSTLPVSTQLL